MPVVLLAAAFVLAIPAIATGQPAAPAAASSAPRPARAFHRSGYEEATIAAALDALGLRRASSPEGKTVEGVDIVRLDVIEERDPAPRFLNVFHSLSRDAVIRRELLLRPGDRYHAVLAEETQRNLAALPQLSLVLVVAAEGSTPDTVRIVVVTKDVWSLRLNWDVALTSNGVESLTINPSETNLLGTHQTVGATYRWLPASQSLGVQYGNPRLAGTHAALSATAGLVLENARGRPEGSFGSLGVTYPLWSSRTEWSWGASGSWAVQTARLYSQGRVAAFALDPSTDCRAAPQLCVPWAYRSSTVTASAFATRSFGWDWKQDVTLGFSVSAASYAAPDLSAFDPATARAFVETRIPASENRVGPYVQYSTYRNEFLRTTDLETLALEEDVRLGPVATVRVYPLLAALGSTHTILGTTASVSWTFPLGEGYVRGGVDATNEVVTGTGRLEDGSLRASLRVASPPSSVGRLVVDAAVLDHYANTLNRLFSLGGDGRLRGYPTQALVGSHYVVANAEFRSRSFSILRTVQVGGVAFYDAGDAFDAWSALRVRQAVGAGARVLFPQFDRIAFRLDVGIPLSRPLPGGAPPINFFGSMGQAF